MTRQVERSRPVTTAVLLGVLLTLQIRVVAAERKNVAVAATSEGIGHLWERAHVALAEFVLPIFLSEKTRYAPWYTERAFHSLKVGDTMDHVRTMLREPLDQRHFPDGDTVWYYSEQATALDNYLARNVVFDERGRLSHMHAQFYVD